MAEPMRVGVTQSLPLVGSNEVEGTPDVGDAQEHTLRLYDECAPGVRRYLRSLSLPPDGVEDVVQEAFLELFRHVRMGRSRHNLQGWLFRVARNAAFKRHRRERRQRLMSGVGHPWTAAYDDAASPEERLVRRDEQRRLCTMINALRDRDRQCLLLRAEGLTYRDISQALGISLGSVAKSLTRAFGRLAGATAK